MTHGKYPFCQNSLRIFDSSVYSNLPSFLGISSLYAYTPSVPVRYETSLPIVLTLPETPLTRRHINRPPTVLLTDRPKG